jgi:branched-chain amino acid transport system permease protein
MAQDVLNALTLGSLYLLFALGMSLAWGTIGILNFAHGSIFMFAAFSAHLIVRDRKSVV